MRLRVDLVPTPNHEAFADTVLVVDVLRATTTALTFLERGATGLYWCHDLEQTRALQAEDVVLAGERGGLAPEGFDHGNSPLEVLEERFDDKAIAMCTTNGTRAAELASQSGKHVLLACLRNAHAAARKARELAQEEIAILCAGTNGAVGLDDVYTAGVLTEYLLAMGDWHLNDGARIALTVRREHSDPLEPLRLSKGAENLRELGLEADVAYCAEVSQSTLVPYVEKRQGKVLHFLV